MARLLGKWLGVALSVLAIPYLVSGIRVESFGTALALALVLGLLNVVLKPLLILLTLPFTLLTFGIFLWVINGFLFWLSSQLVTGIEVESFGAALFASLWISLISGVLSLSFRQEKGRFRWTLERETRQTGNHSSDIELEKDSTGRWS